jgi:hypothetical protein
MTPQPGTVSEGTQRPEDLIPKFLDVLEAHAPDKAEEIRRLYPETLAHLSDDTVSRVVTARGMLLEDLFRELEEVAPRGHYFGAHESDGADFGFWPAGDD